MATFTRKGNMRSKAQEHCQEPASGTILTGTHASQSQTIQLAVVALGVVLIVLIVHWPVLTTKALSFDDDQYLIENSLVRNPSWTSAKRFLSEVLEPSTVGGYYQPLAMISLMMDCAFGGAQDNLVVFNRTSLTLHVVNTCLIVVLLYQLFGQPWAAALAGLLFGVHPLTVEPIPWLAERKTLLATFFTLSCLIVYVRHARHPRWTLYAGCACLYLLALLSKPTSTPIPLLMLLLDVWPLRRIHKRAIVEKIPLFLLGGLSAIITMISQERTCSVTLPGEYPIIRVPLMLCHNIIFYLSKTLWPGHLSTYYPFPEPFTITQPAVLAGVVGTCLLIPLLLISWRWTKALLIGWLFFFVAIFPTLGIVGFHPVIAADRHVYLPLVGLLLPVAWFLGRLWQRDDPTTGQTGKRTAIVVTILMFATALTLTTRRYLFYWQDQERYYRWVLRADPKEPILHSNLAAILIEKGCIDEAIKHCEQALRLGPRQIHGLNNLGVAFYKLGQLDRAISLYRRALKINEKDETTHMNLGVALAQTGQTDQALQHLHRVIALKPLYAPAYLNLGNIQLALGQSDQAIASYQRTLELDPRNAEAHNNLSAVFLSQGQLDKALSHNAQALRLKPDYANAHFCRGELWVRQEHYDEAIEAFRRALAIDPHYEAARLRLKRMQRRATSTPQS